jgi:transcriptional regulator with XRE-family HTH domain
MLGLQAGGRPVALRRTMDVGLRELRERKLLSQRELGEKADVSPTTIIHIEQGKIRAHPRTLRKIAEALGLQPEELAKELVGS